MKVAIGICAGMIAVAVGVHMLGQIGTGPVQPATQDAAPADTRPEFSKAEFSNHVFGKTKAQIRAEFGQPDMVDDPSDSWYYNSLKVYDPDAGTHAIAIIRFEGIQGSEDSVAQVRFDG